MSLAYDRQWSHGWIKQRLGSIQAIIIHLNENFQTSRTLDEPSVTSATKLATMIPAEKGHTISSYTNQDYKRKGNVMPPMDIPDSHTMQIIQTHHLSLQQIGNASIPLPHQSNASLLPYTSRHEDGSWSVSTRFLEPKKTISISNILRIKSSIQDTFFMSS